MSEIIQDKTAFISIVGRPNVGKSSLLNALLGQKVAIVSNKPQTTRTRIMGVLTKEETQLVFIDTPGLHKPRNHLGEYMIKAVRESVSGVDAAMLVIEAGCRVMPAEIDLIERFKSLKLQAILVINKVDLIKDKSVLISQIDEFAKLFDFSAIVPVSAKTSDGLDNLIFELGKLAIPSDHFFESDALTDQPERVFAAEIIREKMLRLLENEVPHGIAVFIERMKEREDEKPITDIEAVIYCEKDSHKGIIIGKRGNMLKKIGSYSRQDMEKFFGCKINLQLWVKVKEDWRNRDSLLRSLGYDNKRL